MRTRACSTWIGSKSSKVRRERFSAPTPRGGAISIVTHTPGNEEKFTAQATGGSFDRRDFAFTGDIPIIKDTLLSTITVSSQVRNGYVNVIPYPQSSPQGQTSFVVDPQTIYPKSAYQTSDNYGGYNVQTIRGKLLWNASDKLTVTTTADWTHQDQTALPYNVLAVYNGNLGGVDLLQLVQPLHQQQRDDPTGRNRCRARARRYLHRPARICARTSRDFRRAARRCSARATSAAPPAHSTPATLRPGCHTSARTLRGCTSIMGRRTPATSIRPMPTARTSPARDAFGGSVTANYNLSDDMSLKSITGYRQITWQTGTDLDGTPETLQEVTDHQHQWQISQEFQLLGKAFDGKLNYVTGLYYFEEAGYVHDFVPFESLLYVYDFQNDVNNKMKPRSSMRITS